MTALAEAAAAARVETPDEQKRWTGVELLVCAVTQLLLVHVAYRIDLQKRAPLLSTSAWAIFFGLVVRTLRSRSSALELLALASYV